MHWWPELRAAWEGGRNTGTRTPGAPSAPPRAALARSSRSVAARARVLAMPACAMHDAVVVLHRRGRPHAPGGLARVVARSAAGLAAAGCGGSDGRSARGRVHGATRGRGRHGQLSRARVPGHKGQRWWWSNGYRAMTTKHVCQGIHYLKRLPPTPANANAYPMILFLHVCPASERHRRELQCDSR